ncbi:MULTISPECIES: hypothetical protein [Pandoraea]|uniref:Uncharacterized protein n=2 Tax=Pandoraea TaxID=93217 RepID=A0A5E4XHE6_9BURK|nr:MULTISPECIES: hypothetical protein [Pandoraea]VVE18012.1 hypothetical protein PCE31107_02998 [Pandoraea cepalis]VVE35849.1 hypothetical protein PTE31013_03919 [Pandoraea terrigena]
MSIREGKRRHALSRYSHVIGDIRLGRLAREQAQSVACLPPSDLEAAVRTGFAVLLSYTDQECGYLGLYVPARDKIIVCAVTLNESVFEDGHPVIAELLDLDEFEHKGGAIDVEVQRRIAGRQLNPVALRAWEAKHLSATYSWPRPRVFIYFELDGKVHTHYARRPPVCRDWIDTYGLENILGHPGVWNWFRHVLIDAKIDPETVISLRVADGIKMRLDIDPEQRSCPDCKYARLPYGPDTEEDKALDVDDAAPDAGSGRLFGWLSGVLKGN